MITRILYDKEKELYDSVVTHPVQTWVWGDFQKSQGHKVYRLGTFNQNKIVSAFTLSFHLIPRLPYSIGTVLRGPQLSSDTLTVINKIAHEENAIFVKFEPEVIYQKFIGDSQVEKINPLPQFNDFVPSPKVAFYPHTFLVDLTHSEDEILSSFHPKTRYNIKLAQKHGVEIKDETNDLGFETYLKLLFDTTRRQGFYLHSKSYHQRLWKLVKANNMAKILIAYYQGKPLAAFMLFVLKDRLFYPYGASADSNREVMAPNLLMWEAIKFGHSQGLKTFDLWGCLGPGASESQNGYGFHRFKFGYGGTLVEFVGTWDLVINPLFYRLYNLADRWRWKLLRLKASLTSRLPDFYQTKTD
ncbi:MAG: peptidoglycan bridge formation glycyltransferase FemA/FemB family protein [Candidatus Shapirobacteria bacterium]